MDELFSEIPLPQILIETVETKQQPQEEENPDGIYTFVATPTYEKYYSSDSAYGVYVIDIDKNIPHTQGHLGYDLDPSKEINIVYSSNLVGKMQQLHTGVSYKVTAKQILNKKFKQWQFEVISISNETPKTIKEQSAFLQSICTIGQANSLLELYPNLVQDVIDGKDDIDLTKTKGIKEFTWNNIKEKILENYAIADILTMLIPLGISYKRIQSLLKGETNPQLLKQKLIEDPYIITEIQGIGFKTADKIALELNPDLKHSKIRVIGFLKQYLKELGESDGHTWVLKEELETAVNNNIVECEDLFEEILEEQKKFNTFLYIEDDKIGLEYYHWVEFEIYNILKEINESKPLFISQEEIDNGIKEAEDELGFEYTQEQRDILINCTKNNLVTITGKAGSGKTSLTRGLLKIYKNYNIGACSLSSKAARRIEEVTNFPAMTIHKLLAAKGLNEFEYNLHNRLPYSVCLLDETSMCYAGLFYKLISALKDGSKLILVGDPFQLNPIGWGNPLIDIINKKNLFQINELTKIQRQGLDSGIVVDANKIRDGIDPLNKIKELKTIHGKNEDMYYMFRSTKEELHSIAIKTYISSVESVGLDNVFLLSPRKENCLNSSKVFNTEIQDILLDKSLPFVKYGKDNIYRLGAKVIHRVNNADLGVDNGETGYVVNIFGMKTEGGDSLEVKYPNKYIVYQKTDLKELELGYCMSVHLSQGSESHTVIFVLDSNSYVLFNNCLAYTAVTRSKSRCLVLAQPYAYDKCISTNVGNLRNTWMKEL